MFKLGKFGGKKSNSAEFIEFAFYNFALCESGSHLLAHLLQTIRLYLATVNNNIFIIMHP